MNRERLEHTLKLLRDDIDRQSFHIGVWRTSCGTAACAFGHEALSSYGSENGLRWSAFNAPEYNEQGGYSAAAEYYDIPLALALHLFSPEAYVNDGDRSYDLLGGRQGTYSCVKEAQHCADVAPEHVVARLENVLGLCKKEAGSQSAVK